MDGLHDAGGMHGFGRVPREADEPVFHAPWEARAFALSALAPYAVPFSDDHLRREIERMAPARYLGSAYYEKWIEAITALLAGRGALSAAELDGAAPAAGGFTPLAAREAAAAIAAGASQERPDPAAPGPRFAPGATVATRGAMPYGHTRLPRYARGRRGTVETVRGRFVFADSHAATGDEAPAWLYTVAFGAREIWGDEAPEGDALRLDLFEPYLAPA